MDFSKPGHALPTARAGADHHRIFCLPETHKQRSRRRIVFDDRVQILIQRCSSGRRGHSHSPRPTPSNRPPGPAPPNRSTGAFVRSWQHSTRTQADGSKITSIVQKLLLTSMLIVELGAVTFAHAQTGRTVDDATLRNAAKSGDEWTTYGLTPGETRYSPLNQINTTNVGRLGLAWSYDVGPRRRQPGSHAACLRTARSTASPTGASSSPSTRAPARKNGAGIRKSTRTRPCAQDLLRRGESRPRAVSGPDHRADHRRPPGRRSMPKPASRSGKRACPIRRKATPSPWLRASPRAR